LELKRFMELRIEFRLPEEVSEKARELGIPQKVAEEKYAIQMEGFLLNEISMGEDEVIDYTIQSLEEE